MAKKKYRAKLGSYFTDEDAQIIGNFLDKKFPNGTFTPKDVLDTARPKRSPLHKYFEWDDSEAAEKYRLQQAGAIVRCIVVNIPNEDIPKSVSIRFKNEDGSINRQYMNTEDAIGIPDAVDQLLADAIKSIKGWQRRYAMFKNEKKLRKIFSAIEKL